ncbi:MAG: serine/threonine protein kinase [Bacteroidetes bacterium]|nr:serine/threonine protein kinase [Bacteroidota bacterium]
MINSTIGKYKITRLIGEGGMASVYEAEHEMLGTKVAVKVLNPILSANTQIRDRFKNEAKMMASFNHPNITKIIDFDEQPHQLSIVMEFLEGEDLNEKIKRSGPLSQGAIKDIFLQTLSAFQYAHEKGVVHRDIKPSNIYVLPNGHVKILDFGIAKLFGQGNEMTQTGTQMGTPIYMSPEQVKADKSIDHRSDIYSLGVTMFYAINGKPPYNSDTDSQLDIFNKIVYEPLPVSSISGDFTELISKACNKNREERFQSCEEWLITLNKIYTKNEDKKPIILEDAQNNTLRKEKFAVNLEEEFDNLFIDKGRLRLMKIATTIQLIAFVWFILSFILWQSLGRIPIIFYWGFQAVIFLPLNFISLLVQYKFKLSLFLPKKEVILHLISSPAIVIIVFISNQLYWHWHLFGGVVNELFYYLQSLNLILLLGILEVIFSIRVLLKLRKLKA